MIATIEMILQEVERFNESIRDALDSKNITNTGEAAKSIRIEFGNDFVRSIGIFYLEFLDTGRGGGLRPPISKLRIWAMQKFKVNDKAALQIAFAVANKIKEVGTEIFRNNKKGIELTDKVKELRLSISSQLPQAAKADVVQVLDRYKKLFIAKQQMKI